MPRDLDELVADGETAETIRSALDSLDGFAPAFPRAADMLQGLRAELQQELNTLEPRLF